MTQEELKKYMKDNLRIYADFEDGRWNDPDAKRLLVITLSLGREIISKTKLWI